MVKGYAATFGRTAPVVLEIGCGMGDTTAAIATALPDTDLHSQFDDPGEGLQTVVFAVGTAHGFEPLRNWFTALYEVLLGQSQGPRFGGFIALYGLAETIALMERALAGDLVTA